MEFPKAPSTLFRLISHPLKPLLLAPTLRRRSKSRRSSTASDRVGRRNHVGPEGQGPLERTRGGVPTLERGNERGIISRIC